MSDLFGFTLSPGSISHLNISENYSFFLTSACYTTLPSGKDLTTVLFKDDATNTISTICRLTDLQPHARLNIVCVQDLKSGFGVRGSQKVTLTGFLMENRLRQEINLPSLFRTTDPFPTYEAPSEAQQVLSAQQPQTQTDLITPFPYQNEITHEIPIPNKHVRDKPIKRAESSSSPQTDTKASHKLNDTKPAEHITHKEKKANDKSHSTQKVAESEQSSEGTDTSQTFKTSDKHHKIPEPQQEKSKKSPPPAEPSQKKKAETEGTVRKVNGCKIIDKVVGKGRLAVSGRPVKILYIGRLRNASGKEFDRCRNPNKPFTFRLDEGEVIPGFDIGVEGMKVGGKREVFIPSQQGYGKRGSPPEIPPNTDLWFEIELVNA
ncbi:putative 39 kDa FK506-binding nuclear protein [Blattamonas nauphoetae]|uniref:peptidylprolyl isomerase n=1 Tax=Blattamonas nauphoetae TaxID=2049346 RepID=A0ABQ9YAM4_9EUKA|nr:putative 39 kDa FK506-binding nuclear protein [Blattamonas nauphoetae]